ncbi:hypothetical protein DF182_10110 [Chitinophaga flava]|uniref:Uncharacterized protein n=1 Tax=Chitinophaga flava TaxID=2259036 RepID=A0A365Y2T4_9BACT|nr:hypothetical protein DF182_10110 [Chitinophaga flava]
MNCKEEMKLARIVNMCANNLIASGSLSVNGEDTIIQTWKANKGFMVVRSSIIGDGSPIGCI